MPTNSDSKEIPIAEPTYMADIRYFFAEVDIQHMGELGVDLSTYEAVKSHATEIFFQTAPPNARMPPEKDRKWSAARSETFKNWIVNGCPRGSAVPLPKRMAARAARRAAARTRKDIRALGPDEVKALKAAFEGIMARPPEAPDSYFALAGLHWLPVESGTNCVHHENRYNPWHRAYLRLFEDALRSIKGCEDVTLPYWDITGPLPDVLGEPPFASYTLPRDIGVSFPKGYVTERNSPAEISQNVAELGVAADITAALGNSVWEDFNTTIWGAHDSGHPSCGETMANPDAAAFDPIFWFFHANWDRLWWKWQQAVDATTVLRFCSTLAGPSLWLDTPPFNELKPFKATADQTIELTDTDYAHPPEEASVTPSAPRRGQMAASRAFRVDSTDRVSIRVKGIDRLKIPGTFVVQLRANGKTIAQKAFFQPLEPTTCSSCSKAGIINMDFIQSVKDIKNRKLSVTIRLARKDWIGEAFPLTSAGNPTVNARFLLQE